MPEQFLVVFLVVILGFWRPNKSFSSISYLFSQRFMVLVWGHNLIIVLIVGIIFTYPEYSEVFFSLIPWSPSSRNYSFQLSARFLQILPVRRLNILLSVRDLFLLMYLNSLMYVRSFANPYRWFILLIHSLFNSYGGSSRILFRCYHINSFVVPIIPVVRWRPSQVCAISILNPFYGNK